MPEDLATIVERMLAREPEQRFNTPLEISDALAPFTADGISACCWSERSPWKVKSLLTHPRSRLTTTSLPVPTTPRPTEPLGAQAALGAGLPTSPTEGLHEADVEQQSGRPAVKQVARSGDHATALARPYHDSFWQKLPPRFTIAAGLGGIMLLAAMTLIFRTKDGTVVVEFDDPLISATIQGEDIVISDPTVTVDPKSKKHKQAGDPIKIRPGEHTLHVSRGGLEFDTKKFKLHRGKEVVLTVRLIDGKVQVDDGSEVIGQADIPSKSSPTDLANTSVETDLSPFDRLRREDIQPTSAALPQIFQSLFAILGDSRMKHLQYIRGIRFSDDGKSLISSGDDGTRVWDLQTFQQTRHYPGKHVSPDRRRYVVSSGRVTVTSRC